MTERFVFRCAGFERKGRCDLSGIARVLLIFFLAGWFGGAGSAVAQQLPSKGLPFDNSGTEHGGQSASVSANKDTGNLSAAAKAQIGGKVYSAWSCTRAYVRWQYTYTGTQPIEATVALKYTFNPQLENVCVAPAGGSAWTSTEVGVRVTDVESGDVAEIPIESKGYMEAIVPIEFANNYRGKQATIKFKPGKSYHIDAHLIASASVAADVDVATSRGAGSAGGSASTQATANIQGMALFTCAKPWIKTTIRNINYSTHDTYDAYERCVNEKTGRPYFAAGAQLRLTAGGCYDRNLSAVSLDFANARILEIRNLSSDVARTINGGTATLKLPEFSALPLEGKTWNFQVVFDPQFRTRLDDIAYAGPLFGPIFRGWAEVEAASGSAASDWPDRDRPTMLLKKISYQAQAVPPRRPGVDGSTAPEAPPPRKPALKPPKKPPGGPAAGETKPDRKPPKPPLKPPGKPKPPEDSTASKKTTLTLPIEEFYQLENWCVVLPIARFEQWTRARGAQRSVSAKMPTPVLPVTVYTPPGAKKTGLDADHLKVSNTGSLALAGNHKFSTEPVVVVKLLDLWVQLCRYETPRGLELCANPRFIQMLEAVGESAEAQREWFNSLYFRAPSGKLYKVTEMGEEVAVILVLVHHGRKQEHRLASARRWFRAARHVALAENLAELWAQMRPRQMQDMVFRGTVKNSAGQEQSDSNTKACCVLFDLVPALQPWPLEMPAMTP